MAELGLPWRAVLLGSGAGDRRGQKAEHRPPQIGMGAKVRVLAAQPAWVGVVTDHDPVDGEWEVTDGRCTPLWFKPDVLEVVADG